MVTDGAGSQSTTRAIEAASCAQLYVTGQNCNDGSRSVALAAKTGVCLSANGQLVGVALPATLKLSGDGTAVLSVTVDHVVTGKAVTSGGASQRCRATRRTQAQLMPPVACTVAEPLSNPQVVNPPGYPSRASADSTTTVIDGCAAISPLTVTG
jgi:hypothetical protein